MAGVLFFDHIRVLGHLRQKVILPMGPRSRMTGTVSCPKPFSQDPAAQVLDGNSFLNVRPQAWRYMKRASHLLMSMYRDGNPTYWCSSAFLAFHTYGAT